MKLQPHQKGPSCFRFADDNTCAGKDWYLCSSRLTWVVIRCRPSQRSRYWSCADDELTDYNENKELFFKQKQVYGRTMGIMWKETLKARGLLSKLTGMNKNQTEFFGF